MDNPYDKYKGFTPGPWDSPLKPITLQSIGEGMVFSNGDYEIYPPLGESGPVAVCNSKENAALMTAAPDLLEDCRDMWKHFEMLQKGLFDMGHHSMAMGIEKLFKHIKARHKGA